ncbi:hypothetical protein GUJ93_ZPchr0013g37052 [Zizania palustris]|uniref:FRIGIDA-like protein n=1 Tax=Zizania palustris TaxID=103762 RepID=A0A8J5WXP9_ZIZPA|nr:hypothetical protein GUJ93_ZPchr0013g37052 [Zizania palustris]
MAPPPASASASAPFSAMILAVLGVTVYSDALNDFLHKWDSLLSRADSISASLPPLPANPTHESDPVSDPVADPVPVPHPIPNRKGDGADLSAERLGRICEGMCSRDLRHFVITRLEDRSWLLRTLPVALRRAPDPAELVFRAIHRYYIRYIRAKSTHAEAACDLLLESYVSAGCPLRSGQEVGNDELRAEAREEVLSWRTLLVRRAGRVAHAAAKDARGLLLLMAAFGVPVEFPAQEIYELLHSSGCLALAKVLKCSPLFIEKLRGVVAHMLNKGIYHGTAATLTAFELQDAFPDAVLANCITGVESVGCRKDQDNEDQYKFKGSRKNDEQKLDHLISIPEYVDDHKQCSPESSSFSISGRIAPLEECLAQPQQSFTGTKRKRTAKEDSVECT